MPSTTNAVEDTNNLNLNKTLLMTQKEKMALTTTSCVEDVSRRRRIYQDNDVSSSSSSSSYDHQHRHNNYIRELLHKPVILSTSPQNNFVTAVVANNITTPSSAATSTKSSSSCNDDNDNISPIRQHQQHQQSQRQEQQQQKHNNQTQTTTHNNHNNDSRTTEAIKQLLCGGIAGSVAKTLTAPLSRLTILFQVHSLVTTKEHRPKFATSLYSGFTKIIERGGIKALYRGNMTSVLHRFPYSAINFYMYENTMDLLASTSTNNTTAARTTVSTDHHTNTKQSHHENVATTSTNNSTETTSSSQQQQQHIVFRKREQEAQTQKQLVRRMTRYVYSDNLNDDDDDDDNDDSESDHHHHQPTTNMDSISSSLPSSLLPTNTSQQIHQHDNNNNNHTNIKNNQHKQYTYKEVDTPAIHKFIAGAVAGTTACTACYPLDLVRTRLTTQLEGQEHYRGIMDAFRKIYYVEGFIGFYSGILPTLLVAVPNFAISYTVYGTLKEYTLDDDLFYNLRKINADSGEKKIGLLLTIICGGLSGILATCITFPMDTIRRRMQIQSVHVINTMDRQSSYQVAKTLIQKEGLLSLYRGLTPELLKVIPMVGTMFTVYEYAKEMFQITHERNR